MLKINLLRVVREGALQIKIVKSSSDLTHFVAAGARESFRLCELVQCVRYKLKLNPALLEWLKQLLVNQLLFAMYIYIVSGQNLVLLCA